MFQIHISTFANYVNLESNVIKTVEYFISLFTHVAVPLFFIIAYIAYCIDYRLLLESQSILFFLFGAYIGLNHFEAFIQSSRLKSMLSIVAIVFSVCALKYKGDILEFSIIILPIYSISIFYAFDIIAERLPQCRVYKHSFWVYALHVNTSAIITKILIIILPITVISAFANYIITFLSTIAIIEITALLIDRKFPFCYKLLSGSR